MDLGPWEIAIIAVVILVLFGSKKLPDTARSLGRSLRIFKSETKGLHEDEKAAAAAPATPAQPTPAERAAQLREEAAKIEQGQLPAGEGTTLNGVPVNQDQVNRTS
ncbi:Sec-independent protein translocase subunit TatA [Actinocorallia longicatena]|uniref:Sec-independent protein translocase protein TatA n=1 Tax=Actinocorallia longicatena TaxID=111803 RepID=A0ABP6Q6Y0_9ACTN